MASFGRRDLKKLAQLAALELSDKELETLQGDLEQILDYVAKLDGLDTQGVKPLYHPTGGRLRERSDTCQKRIEREALLANAPAVFEGMFRVPPVLDGEE